MAIETEVTKSTSELVMESLRGEDEPLGKRHPYWPAIIVLVTFPAIFILALAIYAFFVLFIGAGPDSAHMAPLPSQ